MREIEARWLEIDVPKIEARLKELGAIDQGDDLLTEIIFYDKALRWLDERRMVRLRERHGQVRLAYKHHQEVTVDGTEEIEFGVNDMGAATALLEAIGLVAHRHQEKRRHTYTLGGATIDIDTWPTVPTYLELEGADEGVLRKVAEALGLLWDQAVFLDARGVLEQHYHIPIGRLRWFTFGRVE